MGPIFQAEYRPIYPFDHLLRLEHLRSAVLDPHPAAIKSDGRNGINDFLHHGSSRDFKRWLARRPFRKHPNYPNQFYRSATLVTHLLDSTEYLHNDIGFNTYRHPAGRSL